MSGGSAVYVPPAMTVPAADRPVSARARAEDRPALLLVEDDADIADMYRLGLEREGIDVTVAADGEQALRLAETLSNDIILMDLSLPRVGGLDVIRRLRSDPRTADLPIAVLSNYDEPAMVTEARRLGVVGYMLKTDTTPGKVAEAVHRWVTG